MKALKLFLLTLFAAVGFAAQAQTIEVYKDGRVIDSFTTAQVDSVVYKQVAATPKYYYYVGTVKPTAENLATIGAATEKTEWTIQKSVAYTNNTGVSSPIYYCFATDWNMIYHDSDKITELSLANVSTFKVDNVEYTCVKTGRNIGNGSTKNYYATAR